MESKLQPPSTESLRLGHEPPDLRARWFVVFIVLFGVAAVVIHILIGWVYVAMHPPTAPGEESPLAQQRIVPPEPVQQGSAVHPNSPPEDLALMRRHEEQILGTYGWVDKKQGVVRVPIGRAMDLLMQQGLPTRPPTTQGSE